MSGRWLQASGLVYRVLLRVYPKEFRDLCLEERRRGGAVGLVRLWTRVAWDLASTAVAERIAERKRTRNREVEVNERRLAWAG